MYCRKTKTPSRNGDVPCGSCDDSCKHIIHKPKRRKISKQKRLYVYERDKYHCLFCGKPVNKNVITIDHLIPIDCGGTDDSWNLATMHRYCNKKKGNKLMLQFQKIAFRLKKDADSKSNKGAA